MDHCSDSGYKGRGVNCRGPDPDRSRLASHPLIADVDVVIACGQINACASSQCDVVVTGGICGERLIAHSRVVSAGREAQKRSITNCGVAVAAVANGGGCRRR